MRYCLSCINLMLCHSLRGFLRSNYCPSRGHRSAWREIDLCAKYELRCLVCKVLQNRKLFFLSWMVQCRASNWLPCQPLQVIPLQASKVRQNMLMRCSMYYSWRISRPLWLKSSTWSSIQTFSDTYALQVDPQFFFGDSILVSPVTDDDATWWSISIYMPVPRDTFYDFATLTPVKGAARISP